MNKKAQAFGANSKNGLPKIPSPQGLLKGTLRLPAPGL